MRPSGVCRCAPRPANLQRPAGAGRPAQCGFVLVSLLAAVLPIALLLVTAWTSAAAARLEARRTAERSALLQRVEGVMGNWYRLHLGELDAPGWPPPDPGAALEGLALRPAWRIALSDPLRDGDVLGRVILVWAPASPGDSTEHFDVATGSLLAQDAGTRSVRIDGRQLEHEAVRRAEQQLRAVASALETWFRARVADDPLHRMDRNHFRPRDPACFAAPAELPCLPDYSATGALPFLTNILDLASADLQSPWGRAYPIEISNGRDASSVPPFSIALRVRTPWGTELQARAVQPGT